MRYDLCVIGAGSAGVAAAEAARALGKRVLLATGLEALGGTCILRGCMPAKTLLSSTERLEDVLSAPTLGVRERAPATIDLKAVIARKRELVDYFASDRVDEILTFEIARGVAHFVAPDAIRIGERTIEAERFIIATGSIIDASRVSCLSPDDYFTSDDALEMTTAPKRLIVVGGGPVGCEFAQYFSRVGSDVKLLQDGPELLRNEDPDIGEAVRKTLVADGVDVVCDASIEACARDGELRRLRVQTPHGTREFEAEGVMLASGRIPNIASLDLGAAGVAISESGGIAVDPYLQSSNPRVYAAGDVLGRRCLVHVAVYAGGIAARNAFAQTCEAVDFARFEAHAVYVQPQIAVAGLTERDARERGVAVRVRRHPFGELGKAVVSDEVTGYVKMLADDGDRIRGIAIFGDDAVELAGEAIAVIDRNTTLSELIAMPHLHPTMSEIFVRTAEEFVPAGASCA